MTDEEKNEYYKYQFSGYAPPLIKLDSSGASYWVAEIHPYYKNQPIYWSKGYQFYCSNTINTINEQSGTVEQNQINSQNNVSNNGNNGNNVSKLFKPLKF